MQWLPKWVDDNTQADFLFLEVFVLFPVLGFLIINIQVWMIKRRIFVYNIVGYFKCVY